MFGHNNALVLFKVSLCAGVLLVVSQYAFAASHEEIRERCKEALMPQLRVCVMGKMSNGSGDIQRAKQECGMAIVRPCVMREEQKQAAKIPPPAAPKDDTVTAPQGAAPVQPSFVAPPRTIADITAILDSEKPDEEKIAARKASADAAPPTDTSAANLAQFYYDRGNARALLARNKDALADGLKALAVGKGAIEFRQSARIRQFVALQYRALGDFKQTISVADSIVREAEAAGARGSMINAQGMIARTLVDMGDLSQATIYAGRVEALVQEARGSPNPKWRQFYGIYGHFWEAESNEARALALEARGQYAEAEAANCRAEAFGRAAQKDLPRYVFPPPPEVMIRYVDLIVAVIARTESKQGRHSEAEADARRALLETLKTQGKYSPDTPTFIYALAAVLVEQGRYQEAEKLTRSALDVQRTIGIGDDVPRTATLLSQLGNILNLEHKPKEAAIVYEQLDKAIAQWPLAQREKFQINASRIFALYTSGQIEAGIAVAQSLVKRNAAQTGNNSIDTATARGALAIGYARAGRDADAIREFKSTIPILLESARESVDDDPTNVAARSTRLQRIVEAYIDVLARSTKLSSDVAVETLTLADAVRGHSVQQALANSSARMVVKDPALAGLVRTEQDLAKQINAEFGTLNNLLALPSDQRGNQSVSAINAEIEKLRADRKTADQQIAQRFPSYAKLVYPRPPSIDEIRAALRPGEALLSFYFGQDSSFVWAMPKDGAIAFAVVPTTAAQLAAMVDTLRLTLEPEVATVTKIPPFDLKLAYELYGLLLKPIEAAWKDKNSLIVVTNGALGELPLGLLPTQPTQIDLQAKPLFAGYRDVPWLARTHAVTMIPSASALVTLRQLPPGLSSREKLIGFGDPYFNEQQASEAESHAQPHVAEAVPTSVSATGNDGVTRGAPLRLRAAPHTEDIDTAQLAMLPSLPDTRLELIAIAKALDVDPAAALYLGRQANEQNVKTLNLSRYRIVAFATHGLVPGDINGLTQPALALTAPEVAGVKGDGLLTMEKILGLKLDADWVVLSACNTAAGFGAGAEAASGLGSAFFYAGTRALLVTNWSVQSESARTLITDIFQRQSTDPGLSRGEALRQAMMALLDGPGAVDELGQTLYTYAHPLFWAPYSVIGDSGGN